MNRRSTLPARLVLILATLIAGLLGGGLLAAGFGVAGIARGTSEAIGYPTNTPVPPPPPPATATSVPVLPTATTAPVPPTATTPPAPATATTAPATATPIPPPASPTTAPNTAVPSSTGTVSPLTSATPTPIAAPSPVALSLHLSSPVVASGDTLILTIQTLPGQAVKAVVRYPALNRQVVVTGMADHKGMDQLTVPVTVSPLKGKVSLAALIILTSGDRAHQTTKTAAFTVYPSLRLAVSTMLVTRADDHGILVLVSLARPAAVDVRLVLSGKGQQPILVHAPATPGGDVLLQIPIPAPHGTAKARLQISVRTREGVTETRGLSVPVGS